MLASQDQSGGDATVTIDQRECFSGKWAKISVLYSRSIQPKNALADALGYELDLACHELLTLSDEHDAANPFFSPAGQGMLLTIIFEGGLFSSKSIYNKGNKVLDSKLELMSWSKEN